MLKVERGDHPAHGVTDKIDLLKARDLAEPIDAVGQRGGLGVEPPASKGHRPHPTKAASA